MSDEISIAAPAKINIGLRVLEKRGDGFHGIESIFVALGLCDQLIVRPLEEKNLCVVHCAQSEIPRDNTITAAYRAARTVLRRDLPGVSVELIKRIPLGGGLGGGSSDAAALLKALQKYGECISDDDAYRIASAVGSDVFFFLKCSEPNQAALISGRGEIVKPIAPRCDLHYILVFPEVHSSTLEAYEALDEVVGKKRKNYVKYEELEQEFRKPVHCWNFTNDFTSVLSDRFKEIRRALDYVRDSGARFYEMSGSGSTVFGVYETVSQAHNAERFLSGEWDIRLF